MTYKVLEDTVEAEPVELSGQHFMAVALNGSAHLLDARVFLTLFEPVADPPTETESASAVKETVADQEPQPTNGKKPYGTKKLDMTRGCLEKWVRSDVHRERVLSILSGYEHLTQQRVDDEMGLDPQMRKGNIGRMHSMSRRGLVLPVPGGYKITKLGLEMIGRKV